MEQKQIRTMGEVLVREAETDSRKRTISFSSEEPYRRYFGMEILDHGDGAVELSRLNEVGVVLFNHDIDSVVGRVHRAWVEDGRGMAEIEFDTDEDAEKVFRKVQSGTLKTTSVRYSVDAWEEVKTGAVSIDGRFTGPCRVARKWTPLEVSIVSVPADATVGVGRSEHNEEEETRMEEHNLTQQEAQRALEEERRRVRDIMALCRQTGLDPEEHIKSGADLDTVRAAALDHVIRHGAPVQTGARESGGEDFRSGAVDAVLLRAGVPLERPAESAEQFRGMSLRDMAIECMARDGAGTTASLLRMGKDDLWNLACRQFFNPTAAFPAILDNAIQKAIEYRYQHIPTTFQLWTATGSVTDFKPTKDHSYLVGGAGEFKRVGESGELAHDTPKSELVPQRKIDTYGRQFSMSRQAFINDDIGFITEVPGLYAASAKRTINKQVYSILVNNPAIFDGVPLFDEKHKNTAKTASAPSVDSLQKLMLKLLRQTDPFGEAVTIQPRFVIVPVGYGFLLAQLLETQVLDVSGIGSHTANALYNYRNQLQVIEEGALNALAGEGKAVPWFMAGDPGYSKSIQVDYLNGQEAPTIRRSEVPGQLGYVWDIWLDWGITAVDFRGIARNSGVVIKDE